MIKNKLDQATCFTRRIDNRDGWRGIFPCVDYHCPGCDHALVPGATRTGFPFQLEGELGKGGFARVYKES